MSLYKLGKRNITFVCVDEFMDRFSSDNIYMYAVQNSNKFNVSAVRLFARTKFFRYQYDEVPMGV